MNERCPSSRCDSVEDKLQKKATSFFTHCARPGRPDTEKVRFYDEMASEWDFRSSSKIIVSLGDFSGHVGKCAEGVYGKNGIGKRHVEKIAGVL